MDFQDIKRQIIRKVIAKFDGRFRAFDNTGESKDVVAGQFPDIILKQQVPPPNNNILFVMKVEDGDNMVNNITGWQALSHSQSVLYIIVPKEKLDEARILAARVGVRARFAGYELEGENVRELTYD